MPWISKKLTEPVGAGAPGVVEATLVKPIKNKQQASLQMTYTVPQQQNELMRFEVGVIEAIFVSQEPGSFVYMDMPTRGDRRQLNEVVVIGERFP